MKIKLPVITKNVIDEQGKRIFEYEDQDFEVDTSLGLEMRWESKFPEIAKNETVVAYAQRINERAGNDIVGVLSKLKVIYCYFDTSMTFENFVKMFDFSLMFYIEKLIARIKAAFELLLDGAAEKN